MKPANLAVGGSRLLVCTVGSSPEPVVASLKLWQPQRVLFVHSKESKGLIEQDVVGKARDKGVDLDAGRYDLVVLSDVQDLEKCLEELRVVGPKVEEWKGRGKDFEVIVDFTGGTKCMSAAVVLLASRWGVLFSYVGGSERTKDGVGVVVDGREQIVHQANPWNALGHQAREDFVVLFDRHAFGAAASVARTARDRIDRKERKQELACLANLADAFDLWDRFRIGESKRLLVTVEKSTNDLRSVLGHETADRVLEAVGRLVEHLREMERTPDSRPHVLDLLANAKRRRDESRFDDALARLYRAIEATAQIALRERHGINSTKEVPLARLPDELRSRWAGRAKEGVVTVGLQDAYELLATWGDPAGAKFREAGLAGVKSPLGKRNRSILAHGFECVEEDDFQQLWAAALSLAETDESSLLSVPRLAPRGGKS